MEGTPRLKNPKITGMRAANKAETGAAIVICPTASARYKTNRPVSPIRLEPAPISMSLAGGMGSRKRRARAVKGINPAISAKNRTRYGLVRLLASPPIKSAAPQVAADRMP
jgi:hypothetical protein